MDWFAGRLIAGLKLMEKAATRFQGKGWGAGTCGREVAMIAAAMSDQMPSSPIVFDVGANKGLWTAAALEAWPAARVVMFEPSRTNHAGLVTAFPNATAERLAISDGIGSATLFGDSDGSGLSSLHNRRLDHVNKTFAPLETVETTTLDAYCAGHAIARVDVLKLDVEGHEFAALAGGPKTLQTVRAVQFEFGGTNIDARTYFRDFWYLFAEAGFAIYRMGPLGLALVPRYQEAEECFMVTNYLALRRA